MLVKANKKGGHFRGRPFGNVFSDQLGVLRFPYLADSRNRSVNHSPLGAASQSIADSLSFFYECARRKSRKNSSIAKRKSIAFDKNIFSEDFAATRTRPTGENRALRCSAGVPPAVS